MTTSSAACKETDTVRRACGFTPGDPRSPRLLRDGQKRGLEAGRYVRAEDLPRSVELRAVAVEQLPGRRRRKPGRVHGDRDPVNTAAWAEGCTRETGDEVLIIDSTRELLSTGRFEFERRPAIMLKGKREQVELWVARAKALVSSSCRSAASAPVAN
jgi:hypothetical protein